MELGQLGGGLWGARPSVEAKERAGGRGSGDRVDRRRFRSRAFLSSSPASQMLTMSLVLVP